jgi:hypothetical protein
MAKRGRKLRPCPDVEALCSMIESGHHAVRIMEHFNVGRKTVLLWTVAHGLPRPAKHVPNPYVAKGKGSIYTSQGKAWQALNTDEKVASANTPSTLERFWAKVRKGDDCWEWTAGVHKARGYGNFSYGGFNMHAHRASWMIHNGAIPADLHVLHSCDNVLCVRPDHLFLGTNWDNYDDRDAKGRVRHGSTHPRAKLTEEIVIQIRASSESDTVWAKRLGVYSTAIRDARRGTKWKRVPGANPDFYSRRNAPGYE